MNALATALGVIATQGKYYIGAKEVMEYLDCKENKRNIGVLIDIILIAGKYKGEFEEIPDYSLKFKLLWNLSKAEQAKLIRRKPQQSLRKHRPHRYMLTCRLLTLPK